MRARHENTQIQTECGSAVRCWLEPVADKTYHEHEQQQKQQKQHGFCGVRWTPFVALALALEGVVVAVAVVVVTAGSLGPPNVVVNAPPGWPVPMPRIRYRVGSSTALQDISARRWRNARGRGDSRLIQTIYVVHRERTYTNNIKWNICI